MASATITPERTEILRKLAPTRHIINDFLWYEINERLELDLDPEDGKHERDRMLHAHIDAVTAEAADDGDIPPQYNNSLEEWSRDIKNCADYIAELYGGEFEYGAEGSIEERPLASCAAGLPFQAAFDLTPELV